MKGIKASPGIAIGRVLKIDDSKIEISRASITDVTAEIKKLDAAMAISRQEISKIRDASLENLGEGKAAIFDAHLMILDDPEVYKKTTNQIERDQLNAAWCLSQVVTEFVTLFESMGDEYMRERAADLKDVFRRVENHLVGKKTIDLSLLDEEVILVANDLTPSETAMMNKNYVLGFLTNIGGKTSHSAIMARTLEIPAVVGLKNITENCIDGDMIAFDGETGEVIVNPTQDDIVRFETQLGEQRNALAELEKLKGLPAKTTDGHEISLAGNIGTYHDLDSFERNDADSVGLYRTEFLYMDRDTMPTEDEQFKEYKRILSRLGDKECIIRTLDIGGDKSLPYLKIDAEDNPFLGYRAIRICLQDRELFRTQIRALLRASTYGKMGIMFPMISSLEELVEAKSFVEECKNELVSEGVEVSSNIKIGMMIEVPSAAIISDVLAKHVDFFSLGTNDLIQYSCAVDRINPKVEKLYDPFNPGVLRLINLVAKNAKENGIGVSICGSMAHIPELLSFFIGSGVDKLSMSPMHVLKTKKIINELNKSKCDEITSCVLSLGSAKEIKEYLKEI